MINDSLVKTTCFKYLDDQKSANNDIDGAVYDISSNDVENETDVVVGDHSVNYVCCENRMPCDTMTNGEHISQCDVNKDDIHLCNDMLCDFKNDFNNSVFSSKSSSKGNAIDKNGFKIGFLNVRSLYPKIEEVTRFVIKNGFHIFIINETWLDNSFTDKDVAIDDFVVFRRDRNRHGGGLCIYVNSNVKCKSVNGCGVDIESLWLAVSIECTEIIIGTIYRPPHSSNIYKEQILNDIESLKNIYDNIILLGDLNYDYRKNDYANLNVVNEIEELFCMSQLVTEPTRETLTSSTLIDVILTTIPEQHKSTSVVKVSMSDHYCVQTILRKNSTSKMCHNLVTYKDYKKFVKHDFLQDISNAFYECPALASNDVPEMWEHFKSKFLEISNKHVPKVTRRLKKRFKPWVTHDITQLMYKRDYLKKKAIRNNCPKLWDEYRHFRNQITSRIRKAKKDYFQNESLNCSNNAKLTWKLLNKLLNNEKKFTPPSELTAHDFNSYFSTIGESTAQEYFANESDGTHPWKGPHATATKFKFHDVADNSVLKLLKSLDKDSNCDILGFDSKLLFYCADILAPLITKMINLSLHQGVVVDDWKISRVTPVLKGGDQSNKSNYRPISVISHIAKIVEKVVQRQLIEYLLENDLLSPDQSAYRKHHNTRTSLHKCTEDWIDNICDKTYTAVCSLDISKCFDTIDHKVLLSKLSRYGITQTEALWFSSYLNNRSQYVVCNGEMSSKCSIGIGVPQGSVLGPILFSIFVNDVSRHVYPCGVNLYADDTLLYCSGKDVNEASKKLQTSLNEISEWYDGNRLALNAEKSKCMVIASRYQTRNDCSMNVLLKNDAIEQVNNIKYLGVIIDSNLTWNEHVSALCKNLSFKVSRLSRTRSVATKDLLLTIYNSIIQPTIDYAITVWGHTTMMNIDKIQRLQNLSARIIMNNFDYRNVRGIELVKQLKWMNVSETIRYFEQLIMLKCIHGISPNYLRDHVTTEIGMRDVNTNERCHYPQPQYECVCAFSKQRICIKKCLLLWR